MDMGIKATLYQLRHSLLTAFFIILLAGYSVTFWAWQTAEKNLRTSIELRSSQHTKNVEDELDKKLLTYHEVLQDADALFNMQKTPVSNAEWQQFITAYHVTNREEPLRKVGYLENVKNSQLAEHLERERTNIGPDYKITPTYERPVYTPIIYTEPKDPSSVGYDLSTDSDFRKSIELARDSGMTYMSNQYSAEDGSRLENSLFYPIYRDGASTDRRANISGYVFANIDSYKMFEIISKIDSVSYGNFAVFEDKASEQKLIYKSPSYNLSVQPTSQQVVNVFGKKWIIKSFITQSVLSSQERDQPKIILVSGIFLSTLFALFVTYIAQSRTRALNYREQLDLQDAKDELLSLASHQLRTPATGVKQYVGMVLEGYAGNVPKKQKEILKRAYDSNERQLEIVNQILHIARIESGRLPITKTDIDLNQLAHEVISEQASEIRKRKQRLKKIFGKKPIMLEGDPQYLRMVIENLISNASKYTKEGGSIAVEISQEDSYIILEVTDTGVGIASDDINKLFQKFSRIHNELSISSGGTGIGLYLTRLITELHNGTIEVISRPNVGTTFRVRLPKNQT